MAERIIKLGEFKTKVFDAVPVPEPEGAYRLFVSETDNEVNLRYVQKTPKVLTPEELAAGKLQRTVRGSNDYSLPKNEKAARAREGWFSEYVTGISRIASTEAAGGTYGDSPGGRSLKVITQDVDKAMAELVANPALAGNAEFMARLESLGKEKIAKKK